MEEINDTIMNDEEADQLLRSRSRPKEESIGKNSFKEKLISSDNTNTPLDFECKSFSNISLEDENINSKNHPNFIHISTKKDYTNHGSNPSSLSCLGGG